MPIIVPITIPTMAPALKESLSVSSSGEEGNIHTPWVEIVVLLFCCSFDSCRGSTILEASTFGEAKSPFVASFIAVVMSTFGVGDKADKCLPLAGSIKGSRA